MQHSEWLGSWSFYKAWSRRTAAALHDVADADCDRDLSRRATAIYGCAETIAAAQAHDGSLTLLGGAARCRDRACPLCQWRLALARCGQLTQALRWLQQQQPQLRGWMLTVTVRNCAGGALRDSCGAMLAAWRRLLRQQIAAEWQGTMRALEVTYNRDTDTYHPHIHALIVSDVLDGVWARLRLADAWAQAAGLDYQPIVYFAPAGDSPEYEASKPTHHIATAGAYIAGLKGQALEAALSRRVDGRSAATMARALRGLRLIGYSGTLAAARRALGQGDRPQDEDAAADALTAAQAECIAAHPDTRSVILCAWDEATGTYTPIPTQGVERHGSDARTGATADRMGAAPGGGLGRGVSAQAGSRRCGPLSV